MRRPALSIVLALLMLLAQHGAAVHTLGHLQTPPASTSGSSKALAADSLCLSCLAFAQVGSSAKADSLALPLQEPRQVLAAEPAATVAATEPPAQRSRGPPTVL